MAPLAILIAGLIAAAATGTAASHQAVGNERMDNQRKGVKAYLSNEDYESPFNGWQILEGLLDPIGTPTRAIAQASSDSEVRRQLEQGGLPMLGENGITNNDLKNMLDYYDRGDFNIFDANTWGRQTGYDLDAMRRDYREYLDVIDEFGERPADVDYEALAEKANQAIDAENAQVLALYDQMLSRSNDAFQSELDASNDAYNDYVSQTLSNNAMATNAIAGSTRYEMDRARRNAIQRGASAAQQLTANINAQLGLQNRAAQQQLETSNQLASALLQQRQAASQLRGDYIGNLNADAARRAGLISGTAERKSGLRNSYYNEAESRYDAETEQWKNRIYSQLGDNPYASVYRNQQTRGSSRKSTYGL